MKRFFLRLFSTSLATLVVLSYGLAAHAQQSGGEKRRTGPIAGPVIKLPPGQYEVTTEPGETEQPAARQELARKWEYCAIIYVSSQKKEFASGYTGVAYIRYYRRGGEQVEGTSEDDALANAMNKLGEEGWEMVGIRESISLSDGHGTSTHSYFFKRPM